MGKDVSLPTVLPEHEVPAVKKYRPHFVREAIVHRPFHVNPDTFAVPRGASSHIGKHATNTERLNGKRLCIVALLFRAEIARRARCGSDIDVIMQVASLSRPEPHL